MFKLKLAWLVPLLVLLFPLFIFAQVNQGVGNTIEGQLWTYEANAPHKSPVVVEAISIEGRINQATQSDAFGSYLLTKLVTGRYYLRCHGMGEFIYHQTEGKNTVFILGENTHLKNVDFTIALIKKGRWQQYNYLEHGLVHQDVHVIYQAKNGGMWFKTREGISLFDGKRFTTLDRFKRSYHAIGGIYEDEAGVIWFGTEIDGVFQYHNNQLVSFLPDSEMSQVEIYDIEKGDDGEIWLASGNGLFRYKNQTISRFTTSDGLAQDHVQRIFLDKSGGLWLCHQGRTGAIGLGLTYYDGNQFSIFTEQDGLPSNTITSACQGNSDGVWFGTQQGLVYYDGQDFTTYNITDGLPTNKIISLFMDDQQHLWIGTEQGISRFVDGCFVNYSQSDSNGLISGYINCIYQTIEGSIWFGTNSGALKLDDISLTNYAIPDGLVNNRLTGILVTDNNQLWITSDTPEGDGLTIYDRKEFLRLKTGNMLIDRANKITMSRDNSLWFGRMSYGRTPYDGLASLSSEGIQHYSVDDGLLGNTVSALHADSDGKLWVGSTNRAQAEGDAGLSKFDGDKFTTFSMSQIMGTLIEKGESIRAISSDTSGRIWLGRNHGLSCFDGTQFFHFDQEDGLVSNSIRSLLVDRNNTLWVGTYYGVSRWDLAQSLDDVKFQNYTTANGLSYPDATGQIYMSKDGLVWFGSGGGGVSIFDGVSWSSLDRREGLPGDFVNSITEDKSGNMWLVVAGNGVSRYRRSKIKPMVKIIQMQIGTEIYDKNELKPGHKITGGQRMTIEYSGIDYLTHPDKRQYRYRIRGPYLDGKWSRQTTETHLDYVFNQSGSYVFEVQAINRDLRYSEPASFTFEVVPIWYMNGWIAIPCGSSVFVVLILAVVNGIRYYQQRRESERLELEAQKLQTQMLEQERETRLVLEAELADAHYMQMALLPESAPAVAGLQVAGRNIAAKEVGGDFFDYLEGSEQFVIAVGDVSGKGLKGAMNAVMTSGILRLASDENPTSDSSVLMSKVNNSLCQSMEQDMNVTMVLAQFNLLQKQMTLANAGQHAYPLLKRGNSVEPVKAKGLALGMIPSIPYKSLTVELQAGDLLLFMTDGITEPRNAEGLMYEESGRFHQLISDLSDNLDAEEVVETIIQDVINYMEDDEERDDDITLVVVKVV